MVGCGHSVPPTVEGLFHQERPLQKSRTHRRLQPWGASVLEKLAHPPPRGDCGEACLSCPGSEVDRSTFPKNHCVSETYVTCVTGSRLITTSNTSMAYNVNE